MTFRFAGSVRQTPAPSAKGQAWGWSALAEARVVVLAEAGEFVFELPRFNGLSGALIDALLAPESADGWAGARVRLLARQEELGEEWEVSVYASAIRLRATAGEAHVSWLGGTVALLLRAGEVIERTTPHTVGDARSRRGLLQASANDFMLMRCLLPEEDPVPEEVTWPVRPGDRIVLMSSLLANRRGDARVLRVGQFWTATDAAADLLGAEEVGDPPVGLAVVVVDVRGDGA